MNQKNSLRYLLLALILIMQITILGCSNDPYASYIESELNSELDVNEIEFLMQKSKVEELIGKDYELAPCVYGYEMQYDKLALTVGIDNSNLVRKVIVKNSNYSALSIKVDDDKSKAIKILIEKGFTEKNADMYINDFLSIKLLSNDEIITGIILEKIES